MKRSNRSLNSVRSLAPCFQRLRTRHAKSYDFVCRCCGTTLEPEKAVFEILDAMCKSLQGASGQDLSVREFLEEYEAMQSAGLDLRAKPHEVIAESP